uniref:Putative ovule protein n=1 Tax=Solanum chacoense TaxID=4108 RepID=A0A0V0GJB2_SOLCH
MPPSSTPRRHQPRPPRRHHPRSQQRKIASSCIGRLRPAVGGRAASIPIGAASISAFSVRATIPDLLTQGLDNTTADFLSER